MALGLTPQQIVDSGEHPLLVKADRWERVFLKEIASVQNGAAFSSAYFTDNEGLPLIRIRDVGQRETENFYNGPYSSEYVVNSGDLLIGMDGDFRCAFWNGGKALLNQRVCRVRLESYLMEEKFLYFCLQPYLDAIHAHTSSVTVKHLSSRTVENIPLPLPPLGEQKRIVAKIEELFSELDDSVANLETARARLQTYRQSLLKNAFEGRLTEQWRRDHADELESADQLLERIREERQARYQQQLEDWKTQVAQWEADGKAGSKPSKPTLPKDWTDDEDLLAGQVEIPSTGWSRCHLGDLIEYPKYGTTKKCFYDKGATPVLRIPNVVSGRVNSSDLKFADFETREIRDWALCAGDLLVIRSNGSLAIVGTAGLVGPEHEGFLYAGYLIRLRPISRSILPKYLKYVLQSPPVRKQLDRKAKSTSGVNNINAKELVSLCVPLPSISEQELIVDQVDRMSSQIEELEKAVGENLERTANLRQSILKRAFEGRLVSQDPNDEPASELLARIQGAPQNEREAGNGRRARTGSASKEAG
ncbi:type I restriction enzyme, S subunit [Thiohalospira halophila DSM 15071]|uniref:Type I restriction enzyme, S subunit n=1 Tax=Thiohalospira halophila DSM 15071 TaxID=1123397 RepID=A0A1I1SBW9_9GAMM|nr:restriction endonuclease subunit S [Thiohalospira halophila]SFD43822.1 type I restriction enzyme, S subunit [Thiohalospira halophila DSM 15071]